MHAFAPAASSFALRLLVALWAGLAADGAAAAQQLRLETIPFVGPSTGRRAAGASVLTIDHGDRRDFVFGFLAAPDEEAPGDGKAARPGSTPFAMECRSSRDPSAPLWRRLVGPAEGGRSLQHGLIAIADRNGDGIGDLLCAAQTQSGDELVVLSGASGEILHAVGLKSAVSSYSPRLAALSSRGTGDVWVVSVSSLGRPEYVEHEQDRGLVAISSASGDVLWSHAESGLFGRCVCNAGDMNADGIDDLVVRVGAGIYGINPGYFDGLRILSGKTGERLYELGPQEQIRPHESVQLSLAGDLDDDSVADLVIAHGGYACGPDKHPGGLYAVSMRTGTVLWSMPTLADEGMRIASLQVIGDMTGDGRPEMVIGVPGDRDVPSRCLVVSGSGKRLATIDGPSKLDNFGLCLAVLEPSAKESERTELIVGTPAFEGGLGAVLKLVVTKAPAAEHGK